MSLKPPTYCVAEGAAERWVVVVSAKYATVVVDSVIRAEEIASQYRDQGMEVVIYRELDLQEVPPTLLPLLAASSSNPTPYVPDKQGEGSPPNS